MRFRHHLFICENRRPDTAPKGSCAARGGEAVRQAFKNELVKRGLHAEIRANGAGCLDLCAQGPVVVVYPEGTWYVGVKPEDVPEIVEDHLIGGTPVARLMARGLEPSDRPAPARRG